MFRLSMLKIDSLSIIYVLMSIFNSRYCKIFVMPFNIGAAFNIEILFKVQTQKLFY